MGFTMYFSIIFGTNLLTGGPAQNCCFFAYFRVSQKKNIKRSPNGMKPSGTWFSHRTWSRRLGPYVKTQKRRPRGRGAPTHPSGAASTLVGPLLLNRCTPSSYIYLRTPKLPETEPKNLIPPPQPFVPVRSHLGACSGAPPEGASITEGFYINTIAPLMKCE